jgi:uncharacterized protein
MPKLSKIFVIGVISDTHGLLRPEALAALRKSSLIIHAGDIGMPDILDSLRSIAPVVAVRGNNDKGTWADSLPEYTTIHFEGFRIGILHDVKELKNGNDKNEFDVVISGHSHRPSIERKDGVLYVNPGSAGPRRFRLPVSVAKIRISSGRIGAKLIELF